MTFEVLYGGEEMARVHEYEVKIIVVDPADNLHPSCPRVIRRKMCVVETGVTTSTRKGELYA